MGYARLQDPRRRDLRYDMNRLANPSKRQSNWHVRPYRAEDATARAEVFRQAVQKGAAAHYDQVQRDAWAAGPSADSLKDRLAPQLVLVAVDSAGKVIGFFSLTDAGLVDFAYVMPDLRGSGLADHLLERLTEAARAARAEPPDDRGESCCAQFFRPPRLVGGASPDGNQGRSPTRQFRDVAGPRSGGKPPHEHARGSEPRRGEDGFLGHDVLRRLPAS